MSTTLDATQTHEARHIADEVKVGQPAELGKSLALEFNSLNYDRAKFGEFLNLVKADNAQDQKTNKYLPGIDFGPDSMGNLRVNLTTPGSIFKNVWRNETEVFADLTAKGSVVGDFYGTFNQETAIAEPDSTVTANGSVEVLAAPNSKVEAHYDSTVIAAKGSWVVDYGIDPQMAKDYTGGHLGQVTAMDGAVVSAYDNSRVIAEAGSGINAYKNAQVTALKGSLVLAYDNAQIDAQSGSIVAVAGAPRITEQPGSLVVTMDAFERARGLK